MFKNADCYYYRESTAWYANERVYRSGDFRCFTLYDRVWVVGYYGHEEDLVIPDEIGGRKVEGIIGMKRLSPVKTITVGKYFGELHANTEGKGSMSVFYSIDELEEIRVAESNKNFKSENGVLYSKDMKTLYGIPASIKQTSYTIPETVTQIYCVDDPFRNNKTLCMLGFETSTIIHYAFSIMKYYKYGYPILKGAFFFYIPNVIFTMLAIIPIMLYNNKKGPNTKYILYLFYPLHLLLIYGLSLFLHKSIK